MKKTLYLLVLTTALLLNSGCTSDDPDSGSTSADAGGSTAESVNAADFTIASQPADARSVLEARDSVGDNEEIVITGRIGGSTHPWVQGAAAFTIVDAVLPACSDEAECNCPTPWDYCCETSETIAKHSAMVKFVDDEQRPRRFDAKTVFELKELQTVFVQGKAKRDDAGNLTVLAQKIHIKK